MEQDKKDNSLEERKVKALESISNSLEDINDWVFSLEGDVWSARIEWYLNEFYQLAKSKTVGTNNRPPRDSERVIDDKDISTENNE